ncbi:unnamed protein product [Lathyrus sativus]|nr:unnamed protein product [Lathyrus sativus]
MAARTVRLFHDRVNDAGTMSAMTDFAGQRKSKVGGRKPLGDLSNSVKPIDPVDGGTTSSKTDFAGQKKSKVGGRKPLGDLSNSVKPVDVVDVKKVLNGSFNTVKPSLSQTTNLPKSKNKPAILNKEVVSAKEKNIEVDKKPGIKASKKSNIGGRKVLSDISNSEKAHVHNVINKNSLNTSSFTGKDLHPDEIAEERMFHNHQKCIESRTQILNVHHFFEDDSDDDMKISFEPLVFRNKSESPLFKLEEVPEEFIPDTPPRSAWHGSPVYCKSPEFSSCTMWDDLAVDFKLLMDSPKRTQIV